jgi:hypothetical protein
MCWPGTRGRADARNGITGARIHYLQVLDP